MRILFALLFAACSLSVFDAKAQETGGKENWVAAGRQVINYLVDKHVNYNMIHDARDFGLPAPDSLTLKTADGFEIFAYEICPEHPKGVVICLSGIENPSVTAFYGHAAEFIKAGVATIMPDLRGHGKSDGNRICLAYEETRDVKAVTDYIKSNAKYKGVPVIVMGVSMGGAVAIRSIGENKDIDGLISLSAFSSLKDFLQASREAFLPMIPATELDGVTRHVVKEKYGVDASVSSPVYALRGLDNRPVLMMHSRKDTQVPYSCFEKLSAEASKYTIDLDTMTVEGDEHFICKDFIHPSSDREYMRRVMRFVRKLTSNHPYVKTEEGVELMEIVARFADNTVFNDSIAQRYQKDCDEWFAAWKNHPAVVWLHNQLPVYSIGYEAVPWFGAHLLCKEDDLDLIPNANKEYKRWPRKAIKEFLPLLTDFYLKSNFSEFYRQHSQMYKKAVDAARVTMADYVDLDWFGSFFKKESTADFGIIVGLNNGSGSFGIERTKPGERTEKIAVMLYGEDEDGTPWYFRDSEIDKILVHEFCHSFIMPDKRYKDIGSRLLKEHHKKLNSVGYGIWENVIEETLVRASVIRYLIDHGYSEKAIKDEINNQHEYYGFIWLPKDIEWYKGDVLEIFDEM
ncbi:MAG: alpha/beta fold hydrolase [Prevotella sp.]|nr:alpha/beta fold hydrolase [Prevotella sp.]